jgi:hypothetical protein
MDTPSLYLRRTATYRRLVENEKQVHAALIPRSPGPQTGASAPVLTYGDRWNYGVWDGGKAWKWTSRNAR